MWTLTTDVPEFRKWKLFSKEDAKLKSYTIQWKNQTFTAHLFSTSRVHVLMKAAVENRPQYTNKEAEDDKGGLVLEDVEGYSLEQKQLIIPTVDVVQIQLDLERWNIKPGSGTTTTRTMLRYRGETMWNELELSDAVPTIPIDPFITANWKYLQSQFGIKRCPPKTVIRARIIPQVVIDHELSFLTVVHGHYGKSWTTRYNTKDEVVNNFDGLSFIGGGVDRSRDISVTDIQTVLDAVEKKLSGDRLQQVRIVVEDGTLFGSFRELYEETGVCYSLDDVIALLCSDNFYMFQMKTNHPKANYTEVTRFLVFDTSPDYLNSRVTLAKGEPSDDVFTGTVRMIHPTARTEIVHVGFHSARDMILSGINDNILIDVPKNQSNWHIPVLKSHMCDVLFRDIKKKYIDIHNFIVEELTESIGAKP